MAERPSRTVMPSPGFHASCRLRPAFLGAVLAGLALLLAACGPSSTLQEVDTTQRWQDIELPKPSRPLAPVLNVLVWHNYLSPEVVRRFEQTYGVQVRVVYFSENEELHERLLRPGADFDVIMPGTYMVQQLIRENRLAPIDLKRMPNLRHVERRFFEMKHDPGLRYSVPFYFETAGIAFNVKYASGLPLTWPEFANETNNLYARGRTAAIDEMRTSLGTALLMLGLPPNTRNADEINRAAALLIDSRKGGLRLEMDEEFDLLAREEVIVATAWSGEAAIALARNGAVRFLIPRGESVFEVDSFCVTATSRRRETAEFFINYLLIPEITGAMTNYSFYANTSPSSRAFISPMILNGPAYMEPLPNSAVLLTDAEDAAPLYRAAWQKIKETPVPEVQKVPLPFPRTQSNSVE